MYNPMEIQRIDRQIDELQRMKASFQNMGMGQPPINNIITTPQTPAIPQSAPIFEAKFTSENPANILVQNKTAFINLKDGKLSIKEIDGEIKEYFLILPKDEKDLKIEQLEGKLKEMEMKFNEYELAKHSKPIIEEPKSNGNDNEYVAKSKSKNNFFKSNEQ